MTWEVRAVRDSVEALREIPDASVEAVCTDPPYGITFMGADWDQPGFLVDSVEGAPSGQNRRRNPAPSGQGRDGLAMEAGRYDLSRSANRTFQRWCEAWGRECHRVLRPGGYLLSFGATRTYHRLASGVEDAGFEVRDTLAWMFGSGFPKSMDVGKAIDRAAGRLDEREVIGVRPGHEDFASRPDDFRQFEASGGWSRPWMDDPEAVTRYHSLTAPATPEAAEWDGWGTALKPAYEPVVVARKHLAGTVAANVLEHGTGALNVAACRVPFADADDEREAKAKNRHADFGTAPGGNAVYGDYSMVERENYDPVGRWPANVLLDEEAAAAVDEASGATRSSGGVTGGTLGQSVYGEYGAATGRNAGGAGDFGGASRFFYVAKASRAEREAGCEHLPERRFAQSGGGKTDAAGDAGDERYDEPHGEGIGLNKVKVLHNHHPTVKPVSLMRWLVRLVARPGATVLDPFCGSGTTGIACALEGVDFIGLDREPDFVAIAEARIAFWAEHGEGALDVVRARAASDRREAELRDMGQIAMEL